MESLPRRTLRGSRNVATITLSLLVLAGAGATPASAGAAKICDHCIDAGNDTTSTPGKTDMGSLILGQALNPAVAFIGNDRMLHCALPQAPGWQIDVVDPSSAALDCAMVLDAQSQPLIAYHDANGALLLARHETGMWVHEVVDPSGGMPGPLSIALVPGGVGIAYVGNAVGTIKYAERYGNLPWTIESVTSAAESGNYPSLLADGAVRAIAYYDAAQGDLRLALRQDGSGWSTSLIDSAGDVGGYASLLGSTGVNSFGVAYYDFGNADLKYAYLAPAGWVSETVDGAGDAVGRWCSAYAFTGATDDQIGVAYYDQTHGDLKYALKRGPLWTISTQDSQGDVGAWTTCGGTPSPADTIGIAYADRGTGDLLYQWHAGSLTSAPLPGSVNSELHLEWLRSSAGGAGTVRFMVPAAGRVRVALYDAAGRVVAIPLNGSLPAGPAEVGWDGRDEQGHPVHSGVLFVRVETAGGAASAPAIVLR